MHQTLAENKVPTKIDATFNFTYTGQHQSINYLSFKVFTISRLKSMTCLL